MKLFLFPMTRLNLVKERIKPESLIAKGKKTPQDPDTDENEKAKSPPRVSTENSHQSDNSWPRRKKVTAVIGDSIIKNVQGWRLSDRNIYVVVKNFGGANISDMEDYPKPIIRKEPANLILHVGTNDLHKSLTTHQIAEGIVNLGIQISQDSPFTNITISGIRPRTDKPNLQEKENQVNDLIGKCCTQNNCGFLSHKTIDSTCLNAKGLHLNKKGT
jgi:hypothetical protein